MRGGIFVYFPMIFLTAKDQQKDKLRGLHLGADDYMTKPFDILELITDQEFNSIVFDNRDEDFGVDAVYIDEENNYIN